MTPPLRPGLLVLHGNRLESLAEAVLTWLSAHPLQPLEPECFIVQSNGMAEWLKMEMAAAHGVCAATRIELPARFLWRAWRAVLGRDAVPALSPLDKQPLTWRLMSLLPRLAGEPGFGPVAGFLGADPPTAGYAIAGSDSAQNDPTRRLQLAQRLADLFDQYQVYRSDWLADWAAGRDVLRTSSGAAAEVPIPAEQRWQAALWRAVLEQMPESDRSTTRPQLQQRFLQTLGDVGNSASASTRRNAVKNAPENIPGNAATGALTSTPTSTTSAFTSAPQATSDPVRPARRTAKAAAAASAAAPSPWPALPRRVVLFGTTHLPQQTLAAIAALSAHTQVLMAVPNPCRYHWADTIDGRELLRAARRRQPLRGGRDLAVVPLEDLHAHGHPLLAAWGRQARDFVRQLDAFDDVPQASARFDLPRFELPRVDLFDDGPGTTLLTQLQARIRDLVPMAEQTPPTALVPEDRSIVFHVAHSAQREVEILHDQLLHLLAHPPPDPDADRDAAADAAPGRPLDPRDVVVMVPDIDTHAPAIRSVFGAFDRHAARHIPWGIADQRDRGHHPLLVALEWLLQAPRPRCTFHELRDLLDVPAVARRFGIDPADLPTLVAWAAGAGVRWGLHAEHRAQLDLPACGEANTWRFGLRRMLMGYATGELAAAGPQGPDGGDAWQGDPAEARSHARRDSGGRTGSAGGDDGDGVATGGGTGMRGAVGTAGPRSSAAGTPAVEPYAEVAGLSAHLAGALAELLDALDAWWADAVVARPPVAWGQRLRALVHAVFTATDETERALLAALDDALAGWLQSCEAGNFDEPVAVDVVREAWLDTVDEPGQVGGSRRFKAGGVTFCTLLPLRAIPFSVVCLLGMNDGEYPRRSPRSDFDLMALPGQARPGDRSRRDDDRQLMLDALLSARRVLYVSWAGRSVRDNELQPPSVLVSQLRDHIAAAWGAAAVESRTTEHPLQPFSRRYFEAPATRGEDSSTVAHAAVDAPVAVADRHDAGVDAAGRGLFTYAAEWRSAHHEAPQAAAGDAETADQNGAGGVPVSTARTPHGGGPVTVQALAGFLRNPVKAFFTQRLQVRLDEREAEGDDDEAFVTAGLDRWQLLDEVLRAARNGPAGAADAPQALQSRVEAQVARLQRAGRLPMAGPGTRVAGDLVRTLLPMVAQWQALLLRHPQGHPRLPLRLSLPDTAPTRAHSGGTRSETLDGLRAATVPVPSVDAIGAIATGFVPPPDDPRADPLDGGLDDWLTGLRTSGDVEATPVWIELQASRLTDDEPAADRRKARQRPDKPVDDQPRLRPDKLLTAWVRCLAAAACGQPARGILVGADAVVQVSAPEPAAARETLQALLAACAEGTRGSHPLPTAVRTGMAWLRSPPGARSVYEGSERGGPGENREGSLARLYPDFAALLADPGFEDATRRLYAPYAAWLGAHVDVQELPGHTDFGDEEGGEA